jgi:hypothetical protein
MRFGRLGGWLIIGGGALVAVAIWMYLDGEGVGFGSADASGLLIAAALGLFGVGAVVLCAVGPEPLNGKFIRASLGVLAVGQLGLLAFSILAAASTSDQMANPGIIGLLYLAAGAAGGLGLLLTGLALTMTPGRARLVGALLLAGMVLLVAAGVAAAYLRLALPGHFLLGVLVLAIVGNVAVGLLAVGRGRSGTIGQVAR